MHFEPSFYKRYQQALGDQAARKAVKLGTESLQLSRKRAIEAVTPEKWEKLRNRAENIRLHVIQHLDQYLDQLIENVLKRGGHVCLARTSQEAVEYVSNLAKKQNAKSIIKSKSMVAEEICLNAALERLGCDVVESDFGEWIVQLAGETPSHIIVPALHKNHFQVAELFNAHSSTEVPATVADLCAFARTYLRKKFLNADIGITGCNFAIADAGAINICTNEGNARLVSLLPPTLVAIMGMERVLPSMDELAVMLSLLGRSATGQKLTAYNTLVNGVRQAGELDGPTEFHLVIVDNGRSTLIGTKYEKVLNCIRCGACLNVCPVYRNIGGHAYGWVYPGPIGAVLSPLLQGMDRYGELADATTLCGACADVCPVKIPLYDMLYALRHDKVTGNKQSKLFTDIMYHVWSAMFTSIFRYRCTVKMARMFSVPFVKAGKINFGLGPLAEWRKYRDLPGMSKRFFHEIWPDKGRKE